MYILYAPRSKFGNIAKDAPLLFNDVRFHNNFAVAKTNYQAKIHTLLGCSDITPKFIKKIRDKRELAVITFFATGGIGDSLWIMPAAYAMRKKFPSSKIYIIVEKRNAPIWKHCPYITDVIEKGSWQQQSMIEKSDEVYDFGGIATVLKKYYWKDPIDSIFEIMQEPIPKSREDCRPRITITIEEGKHAEAGLLKAGIDVRKDKFICIGIEPSTANRHWPFDYVKILTEIVSEHGAKVVWLGESKEFEEKYLDEETKKIKKINLVGRTNLREVSAIIAMADAYIGPNSGLMVVATALGTPTIGLFGAFAPKQRCKYYDRFIACYSRQKCSPCNEHWTECREGHPAPCMKAVSPQKVYEALVDLINRYPREIISKLPLE